MFTCKIALKIRQLWHDFLTAVQCFPPLPLEQKPALGSLHVQPSQSPLINTVHCICSHQTAMNPSGLICHDQICSSFHALSHPSDSVCAISRALHYGRPPLANWMSIARPASKGAICYERLSLSLLTTACLPLASQSDQVSFCTLCHVILSCWLLSSPQPPPHELSLSACLGLSWLHSPSNGSNQAAAHFTSAAAFSSM